MTPNEELKFLKPAFLDLFADESPDLSRFVRLVIDVLDSLTQYGPATCAIRLPLLGQLKGCGKTVVFEQAVENGRPVGFRCPECGLVYPWTFFKGPHSRPKAVILTDSGGSRIGRVQSKSDSGVTIIDDGTVIMPELKKESILPDPLDVTEGRIVP